MQQAVPPPPPGASLPREARGWSWGGFLLSWIWGIGNNTFIALLALVPLVGLVMPFVLGAKGNEWAWRNGRWTDVAHFKRVQRRWAQWGVAIWIGAVLLAGAGTGAFLYMFKHAEAYTLAVAKIESSAEAGRMLGRPIEAGFPLGNITVENGAGRAALNFAVSGPKGKGRATVLATKANGVWSLQTLTLSVEGRSDAIDLLTEIRAGLVPRARSATF